MSTEQSARTFTGEVSLEYIPYVNYALFHNEVPVCNYCEVSNDSNDVWENLILRIEGEDIEASETSIEKLPPNEKLRLSQIAISPRAEVLLNIEEKRVTTFSLSIWQGEQKVYEQSYDLTLLPFQYNLGLEVLPEQMATFVQPQHPIIKSLTEKGLSYLDQNSETTMWDSYATQDPNSVRRQIAALLEVLRTEHISYEDTPIGSEPLYVRSIEQIWQEKKANSLELTNLLATCLEAVGLHSLLIFVGERAMVGVWLQDENYLHTVGDDVSFLKKGVNHGVEDLLLIDPIALTLPEETAFDTAVQQALSMLQREDLFHFFVDVFRCRLSHIRPLPMRERTADGWQITTTEDEELIFSQAQRTNRYELKTDSPVAQLTKQMIWERKLLDISLRNNLINVKPGRRVIPLVSFAIDKWEDALHAGEAFQILPNPSTKPTEPSETGLYDSAIYADLKDLVERDVKNKRLYAYLTEAELKKGLTFLQRASRTALEENGANSLFLSLGLLKWYENEKSVRPRFAPLLLLPIDITRQSVARGGGYTIKSRDEDLIFNTTLVELLKQQFGLQLSSLQELPVDDSGVDVKKVFALVRTAIRNLKGWDVIEEATVGLFSFNKFVMWNDIHTHADKLREHPILASLMDNKLQWTDDSPMADARALDKKETPSSFAIPLDVDSSQLEAVIDSGEGKTFILYGPPGTGKSQTITNMIANALYKGKRVLFVAEKMAALSVVQKRLERVGLAPFCLELHSNKVTKAHVLEQLRQSLESVRIPSTSDFDTISEQLYAERSRLVNYIEALHEVHTSGYSLHDHILAYLHTEAEEAEVIGAASVAGLQKRTLEAQIENLQQLDTVFQISGHPYRHSLTTLHPTESSIENPAQLEGAIRAYLQTFQALKASLHKATETLSIRPSDTNKAWELFVSISKCLVHLDALNPALLALAKNPTMLLEWKDYAITGEKKEQVLSDIKKISNVEILKEDPLLLRKEWYEVQQKWFIPRYFVKKSFLKKLRFYAPQLTAENVDAFLQQLSLYKEHQDALAVRTDNFQQIFSSLLTNHQTQWTHLSEQLDILKELHSILERLSVETQEPISSYYVALEGCIQQGWDSFKSQHIVEWTQLITLYEENRKALQALRTVAQPQLPEVGISEQLPLTLEGYLSHLSTLKDWNQWYSRRNALIKEGLGEVVALVESAPLTGFALSQKWAKSIHKQAAQNIIANNPQLKNFNGLLFENVIEKYRALTATFSELTKRELYQRLSSQIPQSAIEVSANSEVGILKRNIANGGRGMSIRKLMDQLPTLLPKLCPCMLMSPISVAQYIDLNAEKFDLVIFDEASQMPTSESVGAIARGKALIVVGDPKQMPPTSFFSSTQVDEEEAEIDDMESILDDCIALSLPSRYLTWHYRSKHESLIAFSNAQYYEGKLYTFPSVDDQQAKVRLIPIQGVYDKGASRSNRIEADAIVAEVLRRLKDPEQSKYSIGIVAFSQVQQHLIEDCLLEEISKHPELEALAFQGEEPIFIKNLENVQGDERDVILFSIGYGPNKQGQVSMNFGPLNNVGGERRLNVAVSRARYEMLVFSSLKPEHIDLKRTKAKGVEGLKQFLEFAERGKLSVTDSGQMVQPVRSLASEVAVALRAKGYSVKTEVGRSNFKIDIAVANPNDTSKYILGIMCDGTTYYATKTTRDREVVQPSVLRMLKWNVMRVWSLDWLENPDKVVAQIEAQIQALLENKGKAPLSPSPIAVKTFDISTEKPVDYVNPRLLPYKTSKLQPVSNAYGIDGVLRAESRVLKQLTGIIAAEAPITNGLLCRRIAELWGIRVSPRLQSFVMTLLTPFPHSHVSETQVTYWNEGTDILAYQNYREGAGRDIQEIPTIERMNAILYMVETQLSLPQTDLKKMVSQAFGFSRCGTQIDAELSETLVLLQREGKILVQGDMVSLPASSH